MPGGHSWCRYGAVMYIVNPRYSGFWNQGYPGNLLNLCDVSLSSVLWPHPGEKYSFSEENSQTIRGKRFPLVNTLSDLYTTTNNSRLVRNPKSGIEDYFCTQMYRLGAPAHPNFTSGPIGVQKNSEIFFFEMKNFSRKICFEKKVKFFGHFWKIPKFYRDFDDSLYNAL